MAPVHREVIYDQLLRASRTHLFQGGQAPYPPSSAVREFNLICDRTTVEYYAARVFNGPSAVVVVECVWSRGPSITLHLSLANDLSVTIRNTVSNVLASKRTEPI